MTVQIIVEKILSEVSYRIVYVAVSRKRLIRRNVELGRQEI